MRLRVLGPLLLGPPGAPVDVPARKSRQILTLLALSAPGTLSLDQLVEALWSDPPPAAAKSVQSHLSRARSALARATGIDEPITGGPRGYSLALDPDDVDTLAASSLHQRGREAAAGGRHDDAATLLGTAHRLWRGEPELPATATGDLERQRARELHLRLVEDHLGEVLASGRPEDAVAELEALTTAEPLRERLWVLRMLALYRTGRQAEALRAYHDVRTMLAEEIGVEPGPELRQAQAAILDQAASLDPPVRTAPAPGDDTGLAVDVPRYAVVGGFHIAYGTYGNGPDDVLLLNPGFIPVDAYLEEPHLAGAVRRLARGRRVVVVDRRGVGLSDPIPLDVPASVDDWVDDVLAVLDAAGVVQADVLANADTSLIALPLARHPERVRSLTLVNGYARFTTTDDYPYGLPTDTMDELRTLAHDPEGPGPDLLTLIAPSMAADRQFRAWWDQIGRRGASPGTASAVRRAIDHADVRHVVADVRVPVLLVTRRGCPTYDVGHAEHLAAAVPSAEAVWLRDTNDPWWLGDTAAVLDAFDRFTAGRHEREPERVEVRSDRRYRFAAPPGDLWAALTSVDDYRSWWPWLRTFEAAGFTAGERWTCEVRPPLRYSVRFTLLLDEVQAPSFVRATVDGDLKGGATLRVGPHGDGGSELRLVSTLTATRSLLRTLGRLAGPAARRGHDWILDTGVGQFRSRALHER